MGGLKRTPAGFFVPLNLINSRFVGHYPTYWAFYRMKTFFKILFCCWVATVACNAAVPTSFPAHIVMLKPDADPDAVAADFGLTPVHVYKYVFKGFAVTIPQSQMAAFKQDPRVERVERNGVFTTADLPQAVSSGAIRMGIPDFPLTHINGLDRRIDVDVAILDTGIALGHPDLNIYRSLSFAPGEDADDHDGHGSHVAGIVGSLDNNIGYVGVAPGVRLWSLKVIGTNSHTWADFLAGLDYVAQHYDEIEVVNASLTNNGEGAVPANAIRQALLTLANLGVVFVCAAGNNGDDILGPNGVRETGDDPDFGFGGYYSDDYFPASLPEAMTVSAMSPLADSYSYYSNYSPSNFLAPFASYVNSPGHGIDLCAPGDNIRSCYMNQYTNGITNFTYATLSGTSMSTAYVSGLVALYIAVNGRPHDAAGVFRLRQALIDTAQPQSAWKPANGGTNTYAPPGANEGLAWPSTNWIPAMKFLGATNRAGGMQLSFTTLPGYTHVLQYKDSLAVTSAWHTLAITNGTGNPEALLCAVTNSQRYYRLLSQFYTTLTNLGSSGSAANGLNAGAFPGVPGAIAGDTTNTALQFNRNHVSVPYVAALNSSNSLSVELWVKPAQTTNAAALITSGWTLIQTNSNSADGNGFSFSATAKCYCSGPDQSFNAGTNLPLNTNSWYHLVGTVDSNGVSLYVNGSLAANTNYSGSFHYTQNPSNAMDFGKSLFIGNMDEAAVYSNSLSGSRVLAHYQAGTNSNRAVPYQQTILSDHPLGYWPMN